MYMQRSRLNGNFRHSSVACERTQVSKLPTFNSDRKFLTAGIAVKQTINKESRLCIRISLNIIYVHSAFGVFQILQNSLTLSSFEPRVLMELYIT